MSYSLPTTSSAETSHYPTQPYSSTSFYNGGFNRNVPLAIVFGPASYGGIGLRHLYVAQDCLKTPHYYYTYGNTLDMVNDVDCNPDDLSYSRGSASLYSPKAWRLLPHAVGEWFPSFATSSLILRARSNNQHIHSLQPAGPRLYSHGGRNDRGFTDGEMQAIKLYLQV
jgi:hypothetical protein